VAPQLVAIAEIEGDRLAPVPSSHGGDQRRAAQRRIGGLAIEPRGRQRDGLAVPPLDHARASVPHQQ